MEELDILTKGLDTLTEEEVSAVKVANATTRPNASGFYGGGGLGAAAVKALFDAYPEKLRGKLDEVIAFANALLSALNNEALRINAAEGKIDALGGGFDTLFGRVGSALVSDDPRFTSNALANAILKLSEDLRKTETSPFDVVYRDDEGILYFMNGKTILASVDLPIETLVKGIRVEADNIILTLENGAEVSVPIDAITERIEEAIFAEELPKAMKDSIVTEGGIEASLEGGKLKLKGTEKKYEELVSIEVTEEISEVLISLDDDGNPLDVNAFYLFVEFPKSTTAKTLDGGISVGGESPYYYIALLNLFTSNAVSASETKYLFASGRLENGMWVDVWKSSQTKNNKDANVTKVFFNHSLMAERMDYYNIREIKMKFYSSSGTPPKFDVGTKIKLYGVRR